MKLEEVLPALRNGIGIRRQNPTRETKWGNYTAFVSWDGYVSILEFADLMADDWEVEDE